MKSGTTYCEEAAIEFGDSRIATGQGRREMVRHVAVAMRGLVTKAEHALVKDPQLTEALVAVLVAGADVATYAVHVFEPVGELASVVAKRYLAGNLSLVMSLVAGQ
jgi:hypothetical protein